MALVRTLPLASSSRMRSKIRMLASTAMPMVSTMPAMPGSVMVALVRAIVPSTSTVFTSSARSATTPQKR